MAEFTSGPWELAWEDGKYGVIADAAGGKLVCIVGNVTPDDGLNDVRKANAQLISMAPELLQACETALQYPLSKPTKKRLATLIAKARGEDAGG